MKNVSSEINYFQNRKKVRGMYFYLMQIREHHEAKQRFVFQLTATGNFTSQFREASSAHTKKKSIQTWPCGSHQLPTVSELIWPTWFLNASGAKPNGYVDLNFVAWACLGLAHEPYSRSKIIPFYCSNVFPFFLDGFHLLSRQKQKRKRMIHILHLCFNTVTRRCTRSIGMRFKMNFSPSNLKFAALDYTIFESFVPP